jgi:hypothetical protein
MARQSGLIKIKGTLDNVNFYKTKDGDLARMKTSVDGNRIKNDPAFERTRENNAEFGTSAKAGKLVRDGARPLAMTASDSKLPSRFTQLMTKIKNLDSVSARGERNIVQGLQDPAAPGIIKGFEFNRNAVLTSILFKPFSVNTTTGEITINDLVTRNDVAIPQGATHISLTAGILGLDFANAEQELQLSPVVNLPIDMANNNVVMTPAGTPSVAGLNLILLRLEFFQEVNGNQYTLKNGAYNALRVVEVI